MTECFGVRANHRSISSSISASSISVGVGLRAAALIALVAGLAIPSLAFAQSNAPAGSTSASSTSAKQDRPTDAALLANFLHFVMIDNHELAESYGNELLARALAPADFVKLVEVGDTDRFLSVTRRAARVDRLDQIASAFLKIHQTGLLGRARDQAEITKNIGLLTGNLRGRLLAQERLVAAGEYAVPQLLEAVLNRSNIAQGAEARKVLIATGRQAVVPLGTALAKMTPTDQEIVAEVLGQIPYRTSLPYLADLAQASSVESVKSAAARSIERLGGADTDAAGLYQRQAEGYYAERSEVTSFPNEEHQLLWGYDPRQGLQMSAIRTEVFHEAMAMRLAERAMVLQSGQSGVSPDTLALWVASNYVREISTPSGYTNPAYPATRRGAEYFGVAAGPEVAQLVLSRAIDTRNTPLARKALSAVERTAGVSALNVQARRPLLEALDYPNRRVQFESALAIASSNPAEVFPGSDRVVPTLASAARGAASQYAAILTSEAELYQRLRGVFEAQGYSVLPQGRTLADLSGPISEAPGIELVIVAENSGERCGEAIDAARSSSKTMATPVLVLTSADAYIDLTRRFSGDQTVAVRQLAAGDEAAARTALSLVEAASGGPINETEAADYRTRSLAAMRDLAVSGSTILKVADATPSLIIALDQMQDQSARAAIADILSRVNEARAQRAIMDAGLNASGDERAALFQAVAGSAKRFGGQLEERQVRRLMELANSASNASGDAEAASAASLMGALKLPNANLLPMVLGEK